jgi:hypothetical protein
VLVGSGVDDGVGESGGERLIVAEGYWQDDKSARANESVTVVIKFDVVDA